ncbi:MAG: hypothetical protein KJO77_01420 [Bacteroidia bacterium]|nr:hypothetical protein [Bacteroidia bacterium]NND53084.1 hypothetical protein [Flavobacteriaceae bacterium]
MKAIFKSGIFMLFLSFSLTSHSQNIEHLMCGDYWATVPFTDFCTINPSHFDYRGTNDICHADSNESYPYDELIYIMVYNDFDEAGAMEEYLQMKSDSENLAEYVELSDIGDAAYALLEIEFGKLDSVIIEAVKGIYSIRIEVNGNSANNSNNCFSQTSVFDFARAVVEQL